MDSDTRFIRGLRLHPMFEVGCPARAIIGNARDKFILVNQFLSGGEPRLPENIMIPSVTGEFSTRPLQHATVSSLPPKPERRHV